MSKLSKKEINIFKPYLSVKSSYVGGKSKSESGGTGQLYKLSSNENMLGPSPMAIEAIQGELQHLNEYSDYTGDRFRKALSDFYGEELSEDQFITANSGVDLLEMICRAFIDPGLESIVCNPCFGPYALFTKKCGGKVVDIPLLAPDFSVDIKNILAAVNDNTRLLFLANPNNPTGTIITIREMEQLIDQLPSHVVIVYDEVYRQFVQSDNYSTGLPFVKNGQQVVAINSFSKAYGLAGLRIGYAYSTSQLAGYIRQIRRPFMLSSLAQEGAMAALKDTDHIKRTVELVNAEKPKIYHALNEIGIQYWKSEANFILIKPDMNDQEFTARMLKAGVMVRPVAGFGAPQCIRVTIGTADANQAFISALKKII